MADRNRHVGQRRAHRIGHRAFVRRIGVGMQQADRDALHGFAAERRDRGGDACCVERYRDRAVRPQLLDHLQPQPPFHQGTRLGPVQVVQHRHAQVADLQDVAEALGGDQRGACALALENRVGADGRAVQHVGHCPAVRRQQRTQAVNDADAVVMRGGGDLVRDNAAIRGDCHDVGEGPADVDPDALRHTSDHVSVALAS